MPQGNLPGQLMQFWPAPFHGYIIFHDENKICFIQLQGWLELIRGTGYLWYALFHLFCILSAQTGKYEFNSFPYLTQVPISHCVGKGWVLSIGNWGKKSSLLLPTSANSPIHLHILLASTAPTCPSKIRGKTSFVFLRSTAWGTNLWFTD